jgi:hypothetical protein
MIIRRNFILFAAGCLTLPSCSSDAYSCSDWQKKTLNRIRIYVKSNFLPVDLSALELSKFSIDNILENLLGILSSKSIVDDEDIKKAILKSLRNDIDNKYYHFIGKTMITKTEMLITKIYVEGIPDSSINFIINKSVCFQRV